MDLKSKYVQIVIKDILKATGFADIVERLTAGLNLLKRDLKSFMDHDPLQDNTFVKNAGISGKLIVWLITSVVAQNVVVMLRLLHLMGGLNGDSYAERYY